MLNFVTSCGLNPYTGYGKLEIGLLIAFDRLGVAVNPLGAATWGGLRELPDTARLQWLANRTTYPLTLITGLPSNCFRHDVKGTKKVFYGMSETDAPSPEWVELFNTQYALVLVSCPALVEYYQAAGVKVPVVNVDMGMDYAPLPHYHKDAPKLKEWRKQGDEFVFLTYSYNDRRKGAHLALMAYNMLFEGKVPGVKLWIKARAQGSCWWDYCQNDGVRVINDELNEAELNDLYRQVDCFVFPSYGEGFGLPPREAVLCGTPAIATKWLGMADVENWGIPIEVGRMLKAYFDDWEANAEGSLWSEPDLDSLKTAMQKAYDMQPDARWVHALRGRRYLKGFTWQKTAQQIMSAIQSLEVAHDGVNSTAA